MEPFILKTKVYLGKESLNRLKELEIHKAFIVCDPFMEQSGKAAVLTTLLEEIGAEYTVFSKVVPDPSIGVVTQGIGEMNDFCPDAVIALGGGSAIDTAKAVCYLYEIMNHKSRPMLAAIPTTSGTGSEVTSFAVISDPEAQAKYPLRSASMVPDVAILDPRFTVTVPPHITADTGMDVLTHAFEAYVSKNATDFTDACGEKAMRLVWDNLSKAVSEGDDMDVRSRMHHASCLAGIAFNGASLGICHSLAHALGARFHIPHGRSNAMLLPHVICYNAGLEEEGETEALDKYVAAARLFGIAAGTKKATVHGLIRHIRNLMTAIGIPQQITELGIGHEEFAGAVSDMAEKALEDACTETNPRIPVKEELEMLYLRLSRADNRSHTINGMGR